MTHILNQHEPGSSLVRNAFALIVFWEDPLWRNLRSETHNQSEISSVRVHSALL